MSEQLIIPSHLAYLIINPHFQLVQVSGAIDTLLPGFQHLIQTDIREPLPALMGLDQILVQLLDGSLTDFLIEEVLHRTAAPESVNKYLNLRLESKRPQEIFIFIEDVTETAELRQALVQRVNETELLLNALKTALAYNDRIITSMQESLIITNAQGLIKTINQATPQLFGYDSDFLLQSHLADLFWDSPQAHQQLQDSWVDSPDAIAIEIPCRTQHDDKIIVEFSATRVKSQAEQSPTFVYVGRDVTARHKLEQEQARALAKAQELSDLKSRFLAMTSHEFKNPLSTILMSVELLEEFGADWSPKKQEKYLHRIKQCTTNMNNLLEDILLIGRADVQKWTFAPQPTNLLQFCQELIDEFQTLCARGHQLILQTSGVDAQTFILDLKLLRHILTNLLSNAIKYSPNGGEVMLVVKVQDQSLSFQVSDQGIGIPPEDQSRLFDYFHRSRNVSDIAGTGLGLSIAKRAVELHQGTISFTTQINAGTTFCVTIPILESTHSSAS